MSDLDSILENVEGEIIDGKKVEVSQNEVSNIEKEVSQKATEAVSNEIKEETQSEQVNTNNINQVTSHEWEIYKSQYWDSVIPEVSKELGIDNNDVKTICKFIGIDSPDILVKIKNDISLINSKPVLPDESIDSKVVDKGVKKNKENSVLNNYNSRRMSWTQIAENIKRDRGL